MHLFFFEFHFSGASAKQLQTATFSFAMSVRLHGKERLAQDRMFFCGISGLGSLQNLDIFQFWLKPDKIRGLL
jgi:hypothetical protein